MSEKHDTRARSPEALKLKTFQKLLTPGSEDRQGDLAGTCAFSSVAIPLIHKGWRGRLAVSKQKLEAA